MKNFTTASNRHIAGSIFGVQMASKSTPELFLYNFNLPLLYKKDFNYTWREHGGFTGHIDYQERTKIRSEREAIDTELIEYVVQHRSEFPEVETYINVLSILYNHFSKNIGKIKHGNRTDIEFCLITGFSRSGGTYLLNEYATMKKFNIRNEHIVFCHDFFPSNPSKAAFDYKNILDELHYYFSTVISCSICHRCKDFFKRSVLGSLYVPYINELENLLPGFTLHWRHIIRDIHGIMPSYKKMYYGTDAIGLLLKAFNPVCTFSTEFGNLAMTWFMCNTSLLPSVQGLPFWDVRILTESSEKKIREEIEKAVNMYINANHNRSYYRLARPRILKFGSSLEEQCRRDGQIIGTGQYQPERFNFRPAIEIDDRYSRIYEVLLQQLTRLYQAFDLDFDGCLERV
jgi:hypothetical protein